MKIHILAIVIAALSLSACAQKEYSAEAIFKEWQEQGDSAPSLVEITALCKKDKDTGHRDSVVCQVENRATSYIFEAKRKAIFFSKQKK